MRGSLLRRFGLWFAASSLAAVYLCSSAAAQPGRRHVGPAGSAAAPTQPTKGTALSSHLAAATAQQWLASPDIELRVQGVRRLGGQNDYGAVQLLLRAIDENPATIRDPRVGLEVVRAVAPFASREPVREFLAGWIPDSGRKLRASTGLSRLVHEQAAMALASTGNARAIEQLVLLVIDGAAGGARAANALKAHPPSHLSPLLTKKALKSPRVVSLLGEIGDMRVTRRLRKLVNKGDLDVRAEAALALARLGDEYPTKAARKWLRQAGTTHSLRDRAVRTLVFARATDAPRAISVLLADPVSRRTGLALAAQSPTPQLAPSLAGLLTIVRPEDRATLLVALARSGGPLAARTLRSLVLRASPDLDAAFALAHCAHPQAAQAIGQMLQQPKHRRLAARLALVRRAALGETVEGLEQALRALQGSSTSADVEVATFGLALLGAERFEHLIKTKDALRLGAACRAAIALGPEERGLCAAHLHEGVDSIHRDALGAALFGSTGPSRVSTRVILDWAETDRPSAVVLARWVGSRDSDVFRARIRRLLSAGDPVLRSQVVLGLARSPESSSLSLLTEAYAAEPDALVRRAVVRALSIRQGRERQQTLNMAMTLDPDARVRSLARLALRGVHLDQPSRGSAIAWVVFQPGHGAKNASLGRSALIVFASGLVLSATSASDGFLLIPGAVPGPMEVRVAPSAVAPHPDSR